jgi:(E)-4-hydroxy-3-methylbut-2-enyl-diphosphate synthase
LVLFTILKSGKRTKKGYPLLTINDYLDEKEISKKLNIIYACLSDFSKELYAKLKEDTTAVLLIDTYNINGVAEQRKIFVELINNSVKNPVIIGRAYADLSEEQLQISASSDFGSLLLDGLGDGVFISAENCGSDQSINSLAFGILQASRNRISKTEYISCPSCGRTLFDLQETTAKIRKETHHLKGVKIGIMGCIVNGPGEMADADYGYVGTGPGKITLYKEQAVVEKNIAEEKAVTALIDLIKQHGDWVEKN